jgi:hypothetical protein
MQLESKLQPFHHGLGQKNWQLLLLLLLLSLLSLSLLLLLVCHRQVWMKTVATLKVVAMAVDFEDPLWRFQVVVVVVVDVHDDVHVDVDVDVDVDGLSRRGIGMGIIATRLHR